MGAGQLRHLNEIDHTKIKPRNPQTNGSVEPLNQTIEEEFCKVALRKKLYRALAEVQTDLEGLELYQRYICEKYVEEKEVMQ